jgi:hypothetical protein
MCLCAEHQCPETIIGEREDDVEILMHIPVMQEMVTIEFSKPPWLLHPARFWKVHAPVNVFVNAIIHRESKGATYSEAPLAHGPRKKRKGGCTDQNQDGAIPPSHWDRFLILLVDEVVGLVGLENLMMHYGVRLKGISEIPHRAVHYIFVECPFKKRCENYADGHACEAPDEKGYHIF